MIPVIASDQVRYPLSYRPVFVSTGMFMFVRQ
jgi:hypothetical protein